MPYDISATGASVFITASKTLPEGITIRQFSDDNDPFAVDNIQIREGAPALDGTAVTWGTLGLVTITVSVIPNSPEDIALRAVWEANRVFPGHLPVLDSVRIVKTLVTGAVTTYDGGYIKEGPPDDSGTSEGRLKTNTYVFEFEKTHRQTTAPVTVF